MVQGLPNEKRPSGAPARLCLNPGIFSIQYLTGQARESGFNPLLHRR